MKKVFIEPNGFISLQKTTKSVKTANLHRYQGNGSFADAIQIAKYNNLKARDLTQEAAYRASQSPYTPNKSTLIFVDNIRNV